MLAVQPSPCRALLTAAAAHGTRCAPTLHAGVVKEGWNGFNVIHDTASRVAALDMGFGPSAAARARRAQGAQPKVVYLLGSDDYSEEDVPEGAFVIYQVRGLGFGGGRGGEEGTGVMFEWLEGEWRMRGAPERVRLVACLLQRGQLLYLTAVNHGIAASSLTSATRSCRSSPTL